MGQSSEVARDTLLGPAHADSTPACYDVGRACWLNYSDVRRAVSQTAALLASPRKALVFAFCDNSIESLLGYLACWTAGHAVLLVDERLDGALRDHLVSLYRPDFLIAPHSATSAREFASRGGYVPFLSGGPAVWRAQGPAAHQVHGDLAVLLSTSGSTGSPKLVRLTWRNVISNALQIGAALGIHSLERAITSLPLHYSYGLSVVNSHLAAGASLVLTNEGLLSSAFWSVFRATECTSLAAVPYMYQMLQRLDLNALRVPTLRTMTQAGGKLHDSLIARYHSLMLERQGRFFVMYGQTEATARIAVLPPDDLPCKLGSVGKPLPGGLLEIESDGQIVTEPLAEGELIYTGPNVMAGYATAPEDLARGPELDGRLHTGDIGYFDRDGFYYVTGRNKRFSKVLGHRINLDEVETMLKIHGPTAVLGGSESLLIYCEYGDDREFACHARMLADRLKLHPSLFTFRKIVSIPLNSNGKPDYPNLAGA